MLRSHVVLLYPTLSSYNRDLLHIIFQGHRDMRSQWPGEGVPAASDRSRGRGRGRGRGGGRGWGHGQGISRQTNSDREMHPWSNDTRGGQRSTQKKRLTHCTFFERHFAHITNNIQLFPFRWYATPRYKIQDPHTNNAI